MKDPQEDDAVERMLNQLEGLLKRQHDSARASRGALSPVEDEANVKHPAHHLPQITEGAGADDEDHASPVDGRVLAGGGDNDKALVAPSNGDQSDGDRRAVEADAYDPDATAPEMDAHDPDAKSAAGGATRQAESEETPVDLPAPEAPAKPVDKEQPAAATKAADKGEPGAATKPADKGEPGAAAKPADKGKPGAAAKPADTGEPGAAAKPADTEQTQPKLTAVPTSAGPPPDEAPGSAHMTRRLTTRLGQMLLDVDLLSEAQLNRALEQQRETGEKLGTILIKGGFINEAALLSVLAKQHGVPTADLDNVTLDAAAKQMIPADMARRYQLIPMAIKKDAVDVAMVDPTDFVAMAHVRFATGLRPNVFITTSTAAERAMASLYAGEEPEGVAEQPRDPRTEIKKMILDRDAMLIGAEQDPRKFYELAASIDAFVDEIIRKAGS